MMAMYIYKITNLTNGKSYIGKTVSSINFRWNSHRSAAKLGENTKLYNAIRKYGAENFTITKVLTLFEGTVKSLDLIEVQLIKEFNTIKDGYNTQIGGGYSNLGLKWSEETKKKQSLVKVGQNARSKHHMFGKSHSKDSLIKIAESKLKKLESQYRSVLSINLGSKEITEYNTFISIKEAKLRHDHIKNACKDISLTYLSCIWLYQDQFNGDVENYLKLHNEKKVLKFNNRAKNPYPVHFLNKDLIQKRTLTRTSNWKSGKTKHPKLGKKLTQVQKDNMSLIRSKEAVLISPNKEIVKIKSLGIFCRENNLKYASMKRVVNQTRNSCFGWKLYKDNKLGDRNG